MNFKKKLSIGAGFFTTTTVALHLFNKYIKSNIEQNKSLIHTPYLYYDWKFGKISYTKQGSGSPVLLVHDLTTYSSSYEWHKVAEILSATNTVYCIDLIGCGDSDKPNVLYTNYMYVQLITDFIENVIGDITNVVATGESSAFVLAASIKNDKNINEIVMINPMDINILTKSPNKLSALITKIINTPIYGTFLYNIFTRRNKIKSLFQTDYYNNYTFEDDIVANKYYENAHNEGSKHLFASLSGFYTTLNIAHCLKSINNNVTIIVSDELDEYKEIAEEYKDIMLSIEIKTLQNIKYLPQLEKPEIIAEIILKLN